jgi:hypothetical protein
MQRSGQVHGISPKNYDASSFEFQLKLNLIDNHNQFIDSILINAVGVSGRVIDSMHVIDSVIADAADSAIVSIQDQIVYSLTEDNKLRSFLHLQPATGNLSVATPASHGLYGSGSKFELDTNSFVIRPIPPVRRWSEWNTIGLNTDYTFNGLDISFGVDLLLQSRFSFRIGLLLLNYSKQDDSYFSYTGSGLIFINPAPVEIIDWGLSAQATYLLFGPRFFGEIGVGLNSVFGTGFTGRINIPGVQRFQPFGIVGFRYQPVLWGFCISASYTPYFNLTGFQNHLTISEGIAF